MYLGTLKYIDGALALLLGLLWGYRQFALAKSYDVTSKYSLTAMRKISVILLLLVILVGIIFTIVCLIMTQKDFAAPVTMTVVVGQLVAWALETRTQSWPDDWLFRIQALRTLTRYRVGKWRPSNDDIYYWFKEDKTRVANQNTDVDMHSTWTTYRLNCGNNTYRYYIKPWNDRNRHYNGNIIPCEKATEHKDKWGAATACASMMASWMAISRTYYCIEIIIDIMIYESGSVRACIGSWQKNYMKYMLLEKLDNSGNIAHEVDRVAKLAVCWLEKPEDMKNMLQNLIHILDEKHSSGEAYDEREAISPDLYIH